MSTSRRRRRHARGQGRGLTIRRLTALLVAVAPLAAACGGDDDSAATATPGITASGDTSGTDTSGTDTSGTDTSGTDTSGTDTSGTDTSGTDTSGTATSDPAASAPAATETAATTQPPVDIVAEAKSHAEELYAGTWGAPPTEGPPLFEGARIMHISCGEALPSCAEPTQFIVDIGKIMGWTVEVRDNNFDPTNASNHIAEAIAGGFDAVTMQVVDCPVVTPALREAKEAGLPVVGLYAHDCTTPSVDGESLMTEVPSGSSEGVWQRDESYGASKADWLIARLDGDVRAIELKQDDVYTPRHIGIGFRDRLAECGSCEIVEVVEFTSADLLAFVFPQKVAQALIAHPEANAIHFPYDGLLIVGGAQAIQDSGRDDVVVVGGEFTEVNAKFLEDGTQDLIMFFDHKWTAYAALDTVNRLLNGEAPAEQGQGWQAVDADHMIELEDGRFRAPVDYETAYATVWGLS